MTEKQNILKGKKIGFLVNPIAGMGGAVGLKGTDGKKILNQAIALGARPVAIQRAESFLEKLSPFKESLKLIVGAGEMGENQAKKTEYNYETLGVAKKETSSEDTQLIAKGILKNGVDLLVYCGGDGTTRDILKAVKLAVPVLGVPTGVKMHSSVFAINPSAAARVTIMYLWNKVPLHEAEVMDVDEQAFRHGRLSAELYGYMLSPFEPHLVQGNKMESPMTTNEVENQAALALYVIEKMKPDTTYIIGPGTTTRTIGDLLDQKKTLLGVDIFEDKKIISTDINEKQILEKIHGKKVKMIVTPIGGQGFIFGRGNQQISAKVIREISLDNIIVIATKSKIDRLESLRVDTGDSDLDELFRAHKISVLIDYNVSKEMSIE